MLDNILNIVAPHHCYGCGKIGRPLCSNCKYDIANEPFSGCMVCVQPTNYGICTTCSTSYERAWCVGDRTETLKKLLNAYKFEHVRAAADDLAELLSDTVADLPRDTIVVPIPTIPPHIRERGYDHALLLAKAFAKRRGLQVRPILKRNSNSHQRGLTKTQRFSLAKEEFNAKAQETSSTYLIVDDILTTNATVRFAAQALRDAGAERVWVAVVARQPLEK